VIAITAFAAAHRLQGSPVGNHSIRSEAMRLDTMIELTQAEKDAALEAVVRTRSAIGKLAVPSESGVYAIYLRSKGLLARFAEGANGVVYIGRSTNLADREFEQHFSSENTGFSTLRRSLGAILKRSLALQAIPRAPGPSESNCRNYRFLADGEAKLTKWMCDHLEVGVFAWSKSEELEKFLTKELRPLLNLKGWPNPHRDEIKQLRKVCADEARQARHTRAEQWLNSGRTAAWSHRRCPSIQKVS
jgi:hypothetical protein